ncbi:MAG TPA: LytTR family DNA-binding domain-containing protein [Caulobacteraceae bacterium]|jgi:hypothetical protein
MSQALPTPSSARLRELALGFAYWLAFVLMLEPDNVLRALQAGVTPSWAEEATRLCGAGVLGAAATPPLLALVRRFPLEGALWPRRLTIQAVGGLSAAVGLLFISVVLARWGLGIDHRPFLTAMREELIANGPLLLVAVAVLMVVANGVRRMSRGPPASVAPTQVYLTQLPVRSRGRTSLVSLDQVDWIETQGNYLAVHIGPTEHLVRESLAGLEPRLDPRRFVRIHRRVLVAVDRVEEIQGLGAGDAALRLKDGTELRLSRSYRDRLVVLGFERGNFSRL